MSKYPIIIFEGIEASGKTTNFKIASNYLKKRRKSFIKLREPGGSIFSEKIRKFILNKKLNLIFLWSKLFLKISAHFSRKFKRFTFFILTSISPDETF